MTLAELINAAAWAGVQINIWPTDKGFQANVKRKTDDGWVTYARADATEALTEALRQRVGVPVTPVPPAAATTNFEDMFE